MLTEKKIIVQTTPAPKLVSLAELLETSKWEAACVLFPYQEVLPSQTPYATDVNTELRKRNFRADESHWSILLIKDKGITVQTFKRSTQLDIFAPHELQGERNVSLPLSFEADSCSAFMQAMFYSFDLNGRHYLLFGRNR